MLKEYGMKRMEVNFLKRILITTALITFALLLGGCEKEIETEYAITVLEFQAADGWGDANKIYIETDEMIHLINASEVKFIQDDKGSDLRLVQYDRRSLDPVALIFGDEWEYELFIPSEQTKEVRRTYAKTLNMNLDIEDEEQGD